MFTIPNNQLALFLLSFYFAPTSPSLFFFFPKYIHILDSYTVHLNYIWQVSIFWYCTVFLICIFLSPTLHTLVLRFSPQHKILLCKAVQQLLGPKNSFFSIALDYKTVFILLIILGKQEASTLLSLWGRFQPQSSQLIILHCDYYSIPFDSIKPQLWTLYSVLGTRLYKKDSFRHVGADSEKSNQVV